MSSESMKWELIHLVQSLRPGQCVEIDLNNLSQIHDYQHNGATFTPLDQVMGNVISSSTTIDYMELPAKPRIMFRRLTEPLPPGVRTYVDPDRRHRFRACPGRGFCDYWELIPEEDASE